MKDVVQDIQTVSALIKDYKEIEKVLLEVIPRTSQEVFEIAVREYYTLDSIRREIANNQAKKEKVSGTVALESFLRAYQIVGKLYERDLSSQSISDGQLLTQYLGSIQLEIKNLKNELIKLAEAV